MIIYNKLVRDNTLDIIIRDQHTPHSRILSVEEYKPELLKKLVEEANEVLAAQEDVHDLNKEIGDLLEVISAVVQAYNLDWDAIMTLKKLRRLERGGFKERIFLESVD